jgi:hypothetical protein
MKIFGLQSDLFYAKQVVNIHSSISGHRHRLSLRLTLGFDDIAAKNIHKKSAKADLLRQSACSTNGGGHQHCHARCMPPCVHDGDGCPCCPVCKLWF